jgi:ABC-type branched-subunit amino acid transport system ATPase component
LLLADQNAMLENGEIAMTGTAAQLRGDPRVRRVYLGR